MIKWLTFLLGFIVGSSFGILAIAAMIAGSKADRREEVLTDAGGSGEQSCEPGDQHDEADSKDRGISRQELPETSEE